MPKHLILDMGNVLLNYDPEYALSRFCRSGEERDTIRRELFQGPDWIRGDMGLITNGQRYDSVSRRIPAAFHPALRACVEGWDGCMVPLPGVLDFLTRQKALGRRLYVLSNACDRFHSYFPRAIDTALFDGILVSSDVHAVKPDPAIYRIFLEKYPVDPADSLFVDDRADNVAGAEAAGIPGYRFDGDYERLTDYLCELDRQEGNI